VNATLNEKLKMKLAEMALLSLDCQSNVGDLSRCPVRPKPTGQD
jgi:hypothetical protein